MYIGVSVHEKRATMCGCCRLFSILISDSRFSLSFLVSFVCCTALTAAYDFFFCDMRQLRFDSFPRRIDTPSEGICWGMRATPDIIAEENVPYAEPGRQQQNYPCRSPCLSETRQSPHPAPAPDLKPAASRRKPAPVESPY